MQRKKTPSNASLKGSHLLPAYMRYTISVPQGLAYIEASNPPSRTHTKGKLGALAGPFYR
jgi:hypothetical protein